MQKQKAPSRWVEREKYRVRRMKVGRRELGSAHCVLAKARWLVH